MADDEDDFERPRWKAWLLNRFVLTPVILLAIAGAWDVYASMHADGRIVGRVVDAKGNPVAGADVSLWIFNFTTFNEDRHVTSGPGGVFTITGNPSHSVQLMAQKPGLGASSRVPLRLYFRGQNATLTEPLVLPGA
ncbi:MAG: carboxypeptidase regulatory-like domain-containing protein [Burkholderiales bacterium]|nr:carboxypeptidase regulatory-like domain-containing protein [Burkholderiales bacterium]